MSEVPDEIRDLQSNVALSMLTDLFKQGKINQEQCDSYKKKFHKLHDTVVQTFKNHHFLWEKSKKLKTQLATEKQNLETALNDQANAQEKAQNLNASLKKTEAEYEMMEQLIDAKQFQCEEVEHEKSIILTRISEQEKMAKSKALPEMLQKDAEIERERDLLLEYKQKIESEQKSIDEKTEKIEQLKIENDEKLNKISKLNDEYIKIKDDPNRFSKNAEMLKSANKIMLKDLQGYKDDISKKNKQIDDLNVELKKLQLKLQEYESQIDEEKSITEKNQREQAIQNDLSSKLKEEISDLSSQKVSNDIEIRNSQLEIRRHRDTVSSLKKAIDLDKKELKKQQTQMQQINDTLHEQKMILENIKKEIVNLKYEIEKQNEIGDNIAEEYTMLEGRVRKVKDKAEEKMQEQSKVDNEIKKFEKQMIELQNFEAEGLKRVKALTATRESMARKASSALAEVRETREELKIKELLIMDLQKKAQETEAKEHNYKSLYEEVKQARNKYVNMIQNSSQDLAELKERIKILQNELEILKNESQEKERTLLEYRHCLQVEVHKKDRSHAKLNKLEYQRKAKKEIIDQNINEIQKLNMIISSLEKDMLNLRKQYEQVCESRNHTGIVLIDRNDELCIMYEKCNIQDNILKSGELEIKRLEDDIRMIKIEIQEQKRKIDVARKDILQIPQLSSKVIQLKDELELEKKKESQLSEELENPNNQQRFRELGGEDPDQEALDAKIHVLEERLNNKKEQLLEKELILDEITNLSEKLRKQALDGRLSTLELSEKVNEFQAKLKDLTRKMMATIAELSMYQATAIKLQQEKDELENVVQEARQRLDKSLPPLPEHEDEYLRQQKAQIRYLEDRRQRLEKEQQEKMFEPFSCKTMAKQRVQQYIPDDITGAPLPKNYGKQAPFYPPESNAQLRFYKKPKVKEIEI
ncbi:unnamed protein product [Paramecium sonneborni]|uniref:Cilia- and flagella-associated protein 58 central coiled coil domain-containing protein n=1 Tax=Paramecium sonneborni TaxID=65129 RepID=A0A8S1KQQ0_9CILI|nr:unnamed protein product [Paramecium sonneborni]